MKCPNCEKEILAGYRHCSNCGYETTPEEWRKASSSKLNPKPILAILLAFVLVAGGVLLLSIGDEDDSRKNGADSIVSSRLVGLTEIPAGSLQTAAPSVVPTAVTTVAPTVNLTSNDGILRENGVNSASELTALMCRMRREGYDTIRISNFPLSREEVKCAECFGMIAHTDYSMDGVTTIKID